MTAATPTPDGDAARPGPAPPAITLPTGGGAIRGIDEKFTANPATGTAGLAVPLPISPGRPGTTPTLELAYQSGGGNGPFGQGWTVALPMVARKTDRGVPRYRQADVFVLSGGEDLVPSTAPAREEIDQGERFLVERYRPRVESTFARIERWTRRRDGDVHWRATSPANLLTIYGRSPAARVFDPADEARVFQWLIEESRDDRGNVTLYEYKQEDGVGVDARAPQERARLAGPGFAQRYLKRVRYLNDAPGQAAGFRLELVLDYGEHDESAAEARPWPVRLDPFSSYRSGFEVRTYRLCRRVLMFHRFPELGPGATLVRSLDLGYREEPVLTKLVSLTGTGYVRDGAGYRSESLPAVTLAYSEPELHREVRDVDAGSLEHLPGPPDGRRWQWADLDGDGLAGVLAEQAGAWLYKRNLGEGRLGPLEPASPRPSHAALGNGLVQLMDLAGDGALDAVQLEGLARGNFQRTLERDWAPFRAFASMPAVRFDDPNVRLVDLTGDGLADVLVTEDEVLRWHASLGAEGFGEAESVPKPQDEEDGPRLVFADGTQTIFLADMSGDGLTDLVRIRAGEVSYWPSLGHGRFGAMVTMDDPPRFGGDFDPERVRLGDVDGSGVTDILYLSRDGVSIWPNQAGNAWGAPALLDALPELDSLAAVEVSDLLGTGTSCLVWASPLPGERGRHLRYVDLMGSRKPHLLTEVSNGLGQRRRFTYAPSTRFSLADRAAGRPWLTRLQFPVHVLERIEVEDLVAQTRLVTTYRYRHGYYDGVEREFAGFGLVEQEDAESYEAAEGEHVAPPVLTRMWSHTGADVSYVDEFWAGDPGAGAPLESAVVGVATAREAREARRALRGRLIRQEVFALDGTPEAAEPYTVTETSYDVRLLQPAQGDAFAVFRIDDRESIGRTYDRDAADPRVRHELVLATDPFGHVTHSASIAYPRRNPLVAAQAATLVTEVERDVVNHPNPSGWYRICVPLETRIFEATGLAAPAGRPYRYEEAVAALAGAPRRLVDRERTRYWRDDLAGPLPFGQVESRALPYETYRAVLAEADVQASFGGHVTPPMLVEAGYLLQDGLWWRPSGREVFDPAAFYRAVETVDPFGNRWTSTLDGYSLLLETATDPLGSVVTARNHYRVLSAWVMTDANGNRSAVRFDPLAVVVATFLLGKGEGDVVDEATEEPSPLDDPTTRVEIDRFRFRDHGTPNVVRTLLRERHGPANPRWQDSRLYLDGSGRSLLTKEQAEPGLAPARNPDGTLRRGPGGAPLLAHADPRWAGTGRTVYDNKGNAVRRWEPFFSTTPEYEDEGDLVQAGVSNLLGYDPIGRLVRTDHPDGSFSMAVYRAWGDERWDENDTVLLGGWHAPRAARPAGDPERRAADLTAAHAATPSLTHFDPLGRAVMVEADTGTAVLTSMTELDIEGNVRAVTDQRGVRSLEHDYDLAGTCVRRASADAGERFELAAADGLRARTWDARGLASRLVYDDLRRVTEHYVADGAAPEELVELTVYGESHATPEALNLRGQPHHRYDASGLVLEEEYDFKGNRLGSTRRFARAYDAQVDWSALAGLDAAAALAAAAPLLDGEDFTTATEFDALNRPVTSTEPDGSVTRPEYNEAGLLNRLEVRLRGAGAWTTFVEEVEYDAMGRRERIVYPGGVVTTYEYDPQTLRLVRLRTTSGPDVIQDLRRTYDPVGNVVEVRDGAQQAVFFHNGIAPSGARYEYDATYRLVLAEGREHAALAAVAEFDWNDESRARLPHPHDATALRAYAEEYAYDAAGNLESLVHHRGSRTGQVLWRRRQEYAADSNRLFSTSFPGDGPGPLPQRFDYDGNGNTIAIPHLDELRWSFRNQLALTVRAGVRVYLVHDATGERARKVVERNGGAIVEDRLYVGGFEIFRRRTAAGLEFERETLHVSDDRRRVAIVETLTISAGAPVGAVPAPRFQIGDALDSASLELDAAGAIISYEEYYPYGGTSFQAGPSAAQVSLKRYRYTGKERDEETGFYACGARLYAPWLARWTSCDPAGTADGMNLYRYAACNPVANVDPTGRQTRPPNFVEAFPDVRSALAKLVEETAKDAAAGPGREFAVAQDLATGETQLLLGSRESLHVPLDTHRALAHSHSISEISSLPSDADLVSVRHQAQAGTQFEHAIYFEDDRSLLRPDKTKGAVGDKISVTQFKETGDVVLREASYKPGQTGNPSDWVHTKQALGKARAAYERVKAGLGSDVASFASEAGASPTFRSALSLGRKAVDYGGKALNVFGAAVGGYQIGTGFDKISQGKVAEGSVDVGEGAANLGLSIGVTKAVSAKLIVAETGIAAGATGALATVAAGGAVLLAGETVRAAIKGEETPLEVADKYYGTGFSDISGWVQRGVSSFKNEYAKVQFYRRRAEAQ